MNRRSGLTLVEVLIAILIMGVGMLSILTLFPIGLLNCRQALQDDRVVQAATNASAIALARNIRHDPLVETQFATGTMAVYVDGFYANNGAGALGGIIPRCSITMINSLNYKRWFALLDDYVFLENGTPDVSPGYIKSPGYYTWAYLLRALRSGDKSFTDLAVVVYGGRSTTLPEGEAVFSAAGNLGDTQITVAWNPATQAPPAITKTGWVLDLTPTIPGVASTPAAQFYRIVSVTNGAAGSAVLETERALRGPNPLQSILVMDTVVEVVERGFGWQP